MNHQILTDEIVLEMRTEARSTRKLSLRANAKKYGVSHPTIYSAMIGQTFAHVPDALTKADYDYHGGGRIPILTADQIEELVANRRHDPLYWTYHELAMLCNKKYGTRYTGSNVKRVIDKHVGGTIARPEGAAMIRRSPNSNFKPSAQRPKRAIEPRPVPQGFRVIDLKNESTRSALVNRLMALRENA